MPRRRAVQVDDVALSRTARFSSGSMRTSAARTCSSCSRRTLPPRTSIELLLLIDAARRASAARITCVHAVLRLFAAGPQGSAARRDRREAVANLIEVGGRRPGARHRLPPASVAGILRCPGRSPVRGAGVRLALSEEAAQGSRGRRARRRRGENGARIRETARRVLRHHRQAAPARERRRSRQRRR